MDLSQMGAIVPKQISELVSDDGKINIYISKIDRVYVVQSYESKKPVPLEKIAFFLNADRAAKWASDIYVEATNR